MSEHQPGPSGFDPTQTPWTPPPGVDPSAPATPVGTPRSHPMSRFAPPGVPAGDLTPSQLRARKVMRIVGPLLLLGGFGAAAFGMYSFATVDDGFDEPSITWEDEWGEMTTTEEPFELGTGASMALFAGGGVAMMAGLVLTSGGWGGAANAYAVNSNAAALRSMGQHLNGGGSPTAPTPAAPAAPPGEAAGHGPYCRECGVRANDDLQQFCGSCGRSLT